jgi:hypothetical protein
LLCNKVSYLDIVSKEFRLNGTGPPLKYYVRASQDY